MGKQTTKSTHTCDNLHCAIAHGSLEVIQAFINQKADVNELDENGFSPLVHAAARSRPPKILQMLVDAKADPNRRSGDATGTSPDAWSRLLRCGEARIGSTCDHILSPLTWATLKKSALKVKILIDAKADVNFMNVHQDKGSTALFLAVEMGSHDIAKLLVEAKAALDVSNQDNYSVLDIAQDRGHHDIAQLLLDADAPRGMQWRMQQACIHGRFDEVKLLLDAGYALHLQKPYNQYPLVLAVEHNRTYIAQMLIAAGAEVNVPGTSLLPVSVQKQNIDIIRSLVAAHADVIVHDSVYCPITYSIQRGDLDLTKALIDAHADVNLASSYKSQTAFHLAVERGDVSAARLLIDAKAHLNRSFDNRTPLACAAENGQLEMMKLLLEANAHVDGGNGIALVCATDKGNAEAVQILLDAKASLKIRDRYGHSPLSTAILGGHVHIVNMLLAAKAELVSPPGFDDPLTVAAGSGNTDIMKILIDANAPLEAAAGKPSPLLAAIENKTLPAMRVLFEAKAATDIPGTEYGYMLLYHALDICVRSQNDNVLRLLLDANPSLASNHNTSEFLGPAYKERRFSILQLLLEKHASVDGVTVDGVPILYQAVSDQRTEIVKLMIDAKADLNVRGPRWNDTPLILASCERYEDTVQMLLEAKATLDATDCNGHTALRHAVDALQGPPVDVSIVQMLVDAKAPLEYAALRAAVGGSESVVVKILVEAKADLRVRNGQGVPLLMAALAIKSMSIVNILLTADPSLFDECDSNGMTPLMFAITKYYAPQDARNVRMLLEHAWAYCAAQNDDEPPAKRFKAEE